MTSGFQDIAHFLIILHCLAPLLNVPKKNKKKKKKCQKSKILNFTIVYATLAETLPRSMHVNFGEQICC